MEAGATARRKLGEVLKELRSGNGLTLRGVEALSQSLPEPVTFDYLSRAESGRFMPSPEKLITLSLIYEVPAQHFLDQIELAQLLSLASNEKDPAALQSEGHAAADRGDYPVAFASFRKSLYLLEEQQNHPRDEIVNTRISLAIVLMCLGKYRLAQREAEAVLELEDLTETSRAAALNTVAAAHYQLNRLDLAEAAALSAARAARRGSAPTLLAKALVNLANVRFDRQQIPAARRLYLRVLGLPDGQLRGYDRGVVLINLANCHGSLGEGPEAEAAFQEALDLALQCSHPRLKALCLAHRGRFLYRCGRLSEARVVLQEARSMGMTHQFPAETFHSSFYLWRIATDAGVGSEVSELFKALKRLRLGVDQRSEEIGFFDRTLDKIHPSRRRKGVRHVPSKEGSRSSQPPDFPDSRGGEGG